MQEVIRMPSVDVPTTQDRPDFLMEYARNVYHAGGRAKLVLGACLHEIKENQYWSPVFNSFKHYVYEEFTYSESTALALIQVYRTFVEKLKVDPDNIQDIGWAKLAMIAPTVNETNLNLMLDMARESDQGKLRKFLKERQGLHVTETTTKETAKFAFQVPLESAQVIKDALKKAEEMHDRDDLPPGMAYECIFADFLLSEEGKYDKTHLESSISSLERIHNVKIEYTEVPG